MKAQVIRGVLSFLTFCHAHCEDVTAPAVMRSLTWSASHLIRVESTQIQTMSQDG